jgi:hypothetical protein
MVPSRASASAGAGRAMAHAENETTISPPPEDVYAFLADGLNNPNWRSGIQDIALKSGTPGSLGAVCRQTLTGPGGRPIAGDYEITTADPGLRLGFQVVAGPARPSGSTTSAKSPEGLFLVHLGPPAKGTHDNRRTDDCPHHADRSSPAGQPQKRSRIPLTKTTLRTGTRAPARVTAFRRASLGVPQPGNWDGPWHPLCFFGAASFRGPADPVPGGFDGARVLVRPGQPESAAPVGLARGARGKSALASGTSQWDHADMSAKPPRC